MKIVFLCMAMHKGGTERVISTLCNHWKLDDQISIVTCLDDGVAYNIRPEIKYYPLIPAEDYQTMGKIRTLRRICSAYVDLMKQIRPDVVISFLPEPCLVAVLMNFKVKAVLIGAERTNPYFQYRKAGYRLLMKIIYWKMNGVVFQTDGAKAFFGERVKKKAEVIGNPIDDAIILKRSIEKKEKKIVSVGRFTYEKNYPMLIRAFSQVHAAFPDHMLYIYGRTDRSLGIEYMIEEMGLQDKVILAGQVDDVHEKIKDAGIFVLSSLSEGMPNALMEAMGLGLTVVATDCPAGGPRQLIEDGNNGLLVENDDENKLAEAILYLIRNRSEAKRMAENAKKITEIYSVENVIKFWKEYICEIKQRYGDSRQKGPL